MNKIFDSVIINLKSDTRNEFYILIKKTLIDKKKCNKFAKYIKNSNFKSKVLELCYCRQLNDTLVQYREFEKLRKFFKKSNYNVVNNYLDSKLKFLKYKTLLDDLYKKFYPVFKNYLNKNKFYYNGISNLSFFYIILKEKIIPILRSYIDINFGNSAHGFVRKVSTAKSYNEKFIISCEIDNRIILLIRTFSIRIVYLVTTNVDSLEHFLEMPFSIKSVLYNNIIIKLINTLNYYIEVYNKYELKQNSLDNILQIELSQISSESESIDENLLNSCNITNDLKMIDIMEDTLYKSNLDN